MTMVERRQDSARRADATFDSILGLENEDAVGSNNKVRSGFAGLRRKPNMESGNRKLNKKDCN